MIGPVAPSRGALRPLGHSDVAITGGFWGTRQEINAAATLRHVEHWLEREGWLGNFDLVVAGDLSGRQGREFSDSEVYKLLEAMAWELGRRHDEALEERFRAIVSRVAAAQHDDGYIGTRFGHPGQSERYSDLEWGHELYCQGHLIQAAVARIRTGHADDLLVEVARRSADHIEATFGGTGRRAICGHAEVEVALAELGRATGESRYLELAGLFVYRHGHGLLADIEWGRSYYQDDVPVREAETLRGHAVRANYLAAAAVDVGVETDDHALIAAIERQWRHARARRTYVTGGQGSRHQDEAFGDDFALPPDRAYSETCAAIASVMVSWRLLLLTGDSGYADAIERALYNVVATSPDAEGTAFFYANTLHQRVAGTPAPVDESTKRALSSLRAPWFEVSCCPTNLARTMASLDCLVATTDDTGIQIHQYVPAVIEAQLGDGSPVRLRVETDYPLSGAVRIEVLEAPARWTLRMRVPAGSEHARLTVGDREPIGVPPGTCSVAGPPTGSVVTLELDMTPRFERADERVDAVRGCVVVQRGPEVWCLESTDLGGDLDVSQVSVDTSVPPRWVDGRVVVRVSIRSVPEDTAWPYAPIDSASAATERDVTLVPYHDWARRGPSTMRVWLPEVGFRAAVSARGESSSERLLSSSVAG